MNFNLSHHRDDLLCVIALLVPMVVAGAYYIKSDREMTQMVRAQDKQDSVAGTGSEQARVRLAQTERPQR